MTPQERVEKQLDKIAMRSINTYARARKVRNLMDVFPEVDMIVELRLAFRRQEERDPEADSMRGLAIHMAAELLGYKK
jgi:hypothetical protein